jgi:NADH-quinone oxidoreductase subunit H
MKIDSFLIVFNTVKLLVVFLLMVQAVPVLVWVERRGSAYIQNRFGPNRVGPLGLMQLLADAVKFLFKEEFSPKQGSALLYYAAPAFALVPAALAMGAIPLGSPLDLTVGGQQYHLPLQTFEIGVGIVFVLGVSSLGTYSLLMAGWGSSSKYSLLGALRASAQMISYELALSLSLVSMLMLYGTFNFADIIAQQTGTMAFAWFGSEKVISFLPNWGFFYNPMAMVLFFASTFAESNRLPFDLPEAEGELVAGFHTEYGGFKMLMFYIGEYGHMMVSSLLLATFFFGGYQIPYVSPAAVLEFWTSKVGDGNLPSILTALTHHVVLLAKMGIFLWIFVWVRWTLPRFRYDQLMDLGWKTMLPWALGTTVVSAIWIYLMHA